MDVGALPPPPTPAERRNFFRRVYHWLLGWAHHPAGTWALAGFAFIDSSIFPIPPLFLQVAMSLERPRRAYWYATVNMVASVLGAVVGYLIGRFLYETLGVWVIETFGYQANFDKMKGIVHQNTFAIALVWSFIPFPYKVLNIAAGVVAAPLAPLLIASTIGRSARFYGLAEICRRWGSAGKDFIERRFNWVLIGVAALVTAVLLVMKFGLSSDGKKGPEKPTPQGRRRMLAPSEAAGGGRVEVPGKGVESATAPFVIELRRDSITSS
jgi:membrane protein YqaA with SNARE-associated domain